MPAHPPALLEPRKSPVQARSTASVEAILDATIQVLLAVGKEALTTTRVAHRAGVSVGTLYQYFPNKSALLQAVLRRHLTAVADAVEEVATREHGSSLDEVAAALVQAFFAAKMRDLKTSVALYAVSSDVDGQRIAQRMGKTIHHAIARLLASAPQSPCDPQLAAFVLLGALAGVSRRVLESPAPEKHLPAVREEMVRMVTAYLATIPLQP